MALDRRAPVLGEQAKNELRETDEFKRAPQVLFSLTFLLNYIEQSSSFRSVSVCVCVYGACMYCAWSFCLAGTSQRSYNFKKTETESQQRVLSHQ